MSKIPDLRQVNGFAYNFGDLVLSPSSPMESARRFIADRYTTESGEQLLFRHRGCFYCWQETHYTALSTDYLTADTNLFLERAAKPVEKDKIVPFNPKKTHVSEVVGAMQSVAFLGDVLQPPIWLGERTPDVEANEIVSCTNGLLHLPTRSLLPHTPAFFTHNALGYEYQPDAPKPKAWFAFLRGLWPDDQASIDTLQEWFGYCLVADTSQQKALMLVGPKRSGKGTIARIIRAVIGEYNAVSPTLAGLATSFGLAPLIDKRLAIISDARIGGKTDTAIVAERILSITGEDNVSIDRKYLNAWDGKLDARFMLLSNELPRLSDASGALASRFIVLVLANSFFGREDHGLTTRLKAECPGILNWAIEGYDRLSQRGHFVQPESALEAIHDLEDLSSPITAFIRDKCIVEAGRSIACSSLFDEWKSWCESQNRGNAGTLQTFGRDIRAAVPGLKTTNLRDGGSRIRVYEGIGRQ